jgi:hypothetical protein
MDRRGFLRGILAAGMAPTVVKAGIIMPVKQIITPPLDPWYSPSDILRGKTNPITTIDEVTYYEGEIGQMYGVTFITDTYCKGKMNSAFGMSKVAQHIRTAKKSFEEPIFVHASDYMDFIGKHAEDTRT